jgi:light-regulated signal transduction histidine kinase (bacteriophytochrome)
MSLGGPEGAKTPEAKIAELARSNAELEAFAQHIAHDLREPLRSIKLVTQFLREDLAGLDQTTSARLVKLGDIAARGERLVGALLEFSRAGQAGLNLAENDLGEIAGEAVSTLAAAISESKAEVGIIGRLPVVKCDRALIAHVLVHLIGNGLKYNKSDPKRVEIGAAETPAGETAIFVRDNGTGIYPRDVEAVFQMFTRRHAREDFEVGAGSGLAISRRIIERHGGRIWIESAPGAGSTVWFTLRPA